MQNSQSSLSASSSASSSRAFNQSSTRHRTRHRTPHRTPHRDPHRDPHRTPHGGTLLCLLVFLCSIGIVLLSPPCSAAEGESFPSPEDRLSTSWFFAMGQEESQKKMKRASSLFDEGEYSQGAIIFGRLALTKHPVAEEAHEMVVRCHLKREDANRGLDWARAYSKRYGASAKIEALKGDLLGIKGSIKEQVSAYERSLALEPEQAEQAELHFRLAKAYDLLEESRKIVEHCQQAVRIDPAYKKKMRAFVKNSKIGMRVSQLASELIAKSKGRVLSDTQIEAFAKRVSKTLGEDEVQLEQRLEELGKAARKQQN